MWISFEGGSRAAFSYFFRQPKLPEGFVMSPKKMSKCHDLYIHIHDSQRSSPATKNHIQQPSQQPKHPRYRHWWNFTEPKSWNFLPERLPGKSWYHPASTKSSQKPNLQSKDTANLLGRWYMGNLTRTPSHKQEWIQYRYRQWHKVSQIQKMSWLTARLAFTGRTLLLAPTIHVKIDSRPSCSVLIDCL